MSHKLKISIGVVVYNGVSTIRTLLDSIAKQTYSNLELVVVDGESTDGTMNILKEYSQYISVLICEPDEGIYDAMNKVCKHATGDWLIFMGCDDELLLQLDQVEPLLTDANTVYYGDVVLSTGQRYAGHFTKSILLWQNMPHQATMYPYNIYKENEYNCKYKLWADYAYNIYLKGMGFRFIYIDLVFSRFNEQGSSAKGDNEFCLDRPKLIRSAFGLRYYLAVILDKRYFVPFLGEFFGKRLKECLPAFAWRFVRSAWRAFRSSVE